MALSWPRALSRSSYRYIVAAPLTAIAAPF
jgi:hypothetical protein